LSPHNAANTLEANRAGLAIAIQNIYNWQQGLPTNVVA
jgi:phosphoglycerate dehydrogenase-like enzyme